MNIQIDFKDLPKGHDCPVLVYCRRLIKQGVDQNTRVECYRGSSLDVIVNNIGLASKLEVSDSRFRLSGRVVA